MGGLGKEGGVVELAVACPFLVHLKIRHVPHLKN